MSAKVSNGFWRLLAAVGVAVVVWASPPAVGAARAQADVACGFRTFQAGAWPPACWRPYAADSPFNRPVPPDAPLAPGSAEIIKRILSMGPIADMIVAPGTGDDWGHPTYYSGPDDPVYTVHCVVYRCEIEGMTVRIPAQAQPAAGDDGHMTVIDQQSGWEWDFWQVRSKPGDGGLLVISAGGRTAIAGDGLGSDANAGQWGLLGGIIRAPELISGQIDHALFMVVGCTRRAFVYPAAGLAATCEDQTHAPAVGQHLQLAMSDEEIEALEVPDWKRTILRALARYGAFVGDTGGNEAFTFQFESGATYTSFGYEDPLVEFAQHTSGVWYVRGTWYFDLASDVEWARRLRVLDPCVAEGTC
jgi:hypothetical protein